MSFETNQEKEMLRSICQELGVPNLVEVLAETPLRRLQPLLINAWKKRVKSRKPAELLAEYGSKNEFYGVSSIPQDALHEFARICFSSVPPEFDIVQTSPIEPVGLNAVLSKVSQNNTLSTIRGSEVVSDVASQLALECAHRRKNLLVMTGQHSCEVVNLSSTGRVLRLQPFDAKKGYMQHFNLFALCSGGRNSNSAGGFAVPYLCTHMDVLLTAIDKLRENGYPLNCISLQLSDMRFLEELIAVKTLPKDEILRNSLNDDFDLFSKYGIEFPREAANAASLNKETFQSSGMPDRTKYFSRLEQNIFAPLKSKHPNVSYHFDFTRKSGLGYYQHLCFHIFAKDRNGRVVQIADGGAVDWLTKLLGNRREAMVTSGIGAELTQKLFSPRM
jgi:hypothetical protein